MSDESQVTFSVKELITEIKTEVSALRHEIQGFMGKHAAELSALQTRVAAVEVDQKDFRTELESEQRHKAQLRNGMVASAVTGGLGVIGAVVAVFIHH